MTVRVLRSLRPTQEEPPVAASSEDQIKLYTLLVDQLTKYNAIFWQAPALAAINFVAVDKLSSASPWAVVALAVFNGAMIYAFGRMVVRQSQITKVTKSAERELGKAYEGFVPDFQDSGASSRTVLVATMAVLDVGLLWFGLHEAYAKHPKLVWLVLIVLAIVVVGIAVTLTIKRPTTAPGRTKPPPA
jgi:hypothetical protein